MQATTNSTRTFMPQPNTDKSDSDKAKKSKGTSWRKRLPWIIVIILAVASVFLFFQYQQAKTKLNTTETGTSQSADLIKRVSKLVIVPANETPTIATVVHADKLRSQSFFASAQDGDKVLVFSKEKQAILYRPSTNQIVTIAPVNVTQPTTGSNLTTN